MGFKNVESVLETLKKVFEQRPNEVMWIIKNIQALQNQIQSWHVEESHQTTVDSFFQPT